MTGRSINMLSNKAIEYGLKIYIDENICKKCGSNIFYTKGYSCVNCSIARGKNRYAKKKEEISIARKIKGKTEKDKEYNKKWRLNNKDCIRKARLKWNKNNPEKCKIQKKNEKAKRRGAEGSFNKNDIEQILKQQKHKCAVCKCCIKTKFHVDHIKPIARGGSNDRKNLQILCPPCNMKKGAKDPIDFMQGNGFLL